MPNSTLRRHAAVAALVLLAAMAPAVLAQGPLTTAAPTPPPTPPLTSPALANLRPVLAQASAAVSNLRIEHWKAPAAVRSSCAGDVASIQRDLTSTLPPLLDQAQAASSNGALASSFSVFRNIDALYDVLLRVAQIANLSGSTEESESLESARAALESGRTQLADSLLASFSAQDARIASLRAQATVSKAPPLKPTTTVVVDDGPKTTPRHKRKSSTPAPQ